MSGTAPTPSVAQPTKAGKERSKVEQLFNVFVFLLFLGLWALFAYALVANQGGLDRVWEWSRSLPLIAQALVWLLTLPLAIGLWIWETSWPLVVRLVLVVGIAGWNLWMFYPLKS